MSRPQWAAGRPRLTRDNEGIIAVWNFCGSTFNPDVLPLACAYLGIALSEYLLDGLLALRDLIGRRNADAEAV